MSLTVLKIGGSILNGSYIGTIIDSISRFNSGSLIIVHGGGPSVTELCIRLGIEPKFVESPDGIRSRYTDWATMEAFVMEMRGLINSRLVLELQRHGIRAAGISGIDGSTLLAERKRRLVVLNNRGRRMIIEGGYTGKITKVDTTLPRMLMSSGFTPVIAPIALGSEYEPLNVDGDRTAAAIASSLAAERLIFLTNVNGVFIENSIVRRIQLKDLDDITRKVGHGMDKKLIASKEALLNGCDEVVISNGSGPDPLMDAISGDERTVIAK